MTIPVLRRGLMTALISKPHATAVVEVQEITLGTGNGAPLHLHLCPAFGVIMDGKIAFEVEGEPTLHLKAGDAFYEPAGARISKFNNEGDTPATFTVFYLLEENKKETIRVLPN